METRIQPPNAAGLPAEPPSTAELAKELLSEARELIQIEIQLAKEEARTELISVKRAAIAAGIALGLAVLGLNAVITAVILAFGASVLAGLGVAGALLAAGALVAAYAYSRAPKSVLGKTRDRLKEDVTRLKEHVA